MRPVAPLTPRELWAYLEGEVTRSESVAIEARLADAASARERLARLAGLREALAAPDPALEGVDLVAGLQAAILGQQPAARPRPRARLRVVLAAAALCLVAAVALPLWLVLRERGAADPDEFRARSAAAPGHPRDRWVGIQAFTARERGAPARLGEQERLPGGHGLLFAYTNTGPRPMPYLMIFAVDELGEVYWFYPAYERAGTDPGSRPIGRGSDVELPHLIRHDFRGARLVIYGLFTRERVRVSQIEGLVRGLVRSGRWSTERPPRIAIAGSAQHRLRVRVER